MSAEKTERSPDEAVVATQVVEGEIRDFVRRDVLAMRKGRDGAPETVVPDNIGTLIERVSGTSVREIDNLITELQQVRDFLHAEGERVQRELTQYAHTTQTALASIKIISDSMGQWKNAAGAGAAAAAAARRPRA